ncbi:MAG: PQQ-dependent sugar dehydrogenase [Gemmobacter sp.]|uniref:PQQ-dependent sugar dehydrogenase n=1 Tax=Gemmobacter sp. TaxID=1898957 RepID=UPI001A481812|nr:PQQ-dependent sugar dehydrogenase [Gemmobacter sp.]MBL8560872.1 PQQ-dependent sugar dehydrogenase [Gemmobacter sp.]
MRRGLGHLVSGVLALAPVCAAAQEVIQTSAGPMRVVAQAEGLDEPWAFAFLPDGAILVTERAGRLSLLTQAGRQEVSGLPAVFAEGQGGLLDVMVPRDFARSREVWLSFAAPVEGGGATAAGRGRLSADGTRLEGFETLFTAEPYAGGRHFGARLLEAPDGAIWLTTGDRGTGPDGMEAQDPAKVAGKLVRMARDGAVTALKPGWAPGVQTLGHRNIQGAAFAPDGRLLTVEHGARGGDELNQITTSGANFGWPVITYGRNYNFLPIGEGTAKPGMEQPLHYWDPSIAPSGLMVYSGRLVPAWQGDLFTGSLNSGFIARLDPETPAETGYAEEQIAGETTGRVRDIAEGPEGAIWFLSVIDGALYRMEPEG